MAFPFKDKALLLKVGALDLYGQHKPGSAVMIDCSILSLTETAKLTATKQSATKGRAADDTVLATMIVPLSLNVLPQDVLVIAPADVETGLHLRVIAALPKTDVTGKPRFTSLTLGITGE